MSDIAMLVAEEYERRVRILRQETSGGAQGKKLEIDMGSCVSAMAEKLKEKVGTDNSQILQWLREPKTQIGVAASDNFFSA